MDALLSVLVVLATIAVIYGFTLAITPALRRRMASQGRPDRSKLPPAVERKVMGIALAAAAFVSIPAILIPTPWMKLVVTLAAAAAAIVVFFVRRHGDDRG